VQFDALWEHQVIEVIKSGTENRRFSVPLLKVGRVGLGSAAPVTHYELSTSLLSWVTGRQTVLRIGDNGHIRVQFNKMFNKIYQYRSKSRSLLL